MDAFLIIITGAPCTGKTTLGKEISERFNIPIISRDDIKESLFDSLGYSDREWSKKLGIASYSLLYQFVESMMSSGISLIVESNFNPAFDNKKLQRLREKYHYAPIQIYCKADPGILLERFRSRSESGERHPGHVDNQNDEEMKELFSDDSHTPLEIGGEVFEVDTTEIEAIDYHALFKAIRSAIGTP